jgi:hypothetical protein
MNQFQPSYGLKRIFEFISRKTGGSVPANPISKLSLKYSLAGDGRLPRIPLQAQDPQCGSAEKTGAFLKQLIEETFDI